MRERGQMALNMSFYKGPTPMIVTNRFFFLFHICIQ
jgi:hypothetical protein